ncbi:MAG: MFS transporter [Chloroflexota bacterium]
MEVAVKKPTRIFYGWWIVVASFAAQMISGGVYTYGLSAFFQPLLDALQCSRVVLSGAFSLKGLETGLLGPLDGFLVDRFGAKKMTLFGTIMAGGGFILLGRISSVVAFYAVFILLAVGVALGFHTALMTAIGNWFRKKRGLAFGITQSGLGMAGVIVPLIALTITRQGWRFAAQVIGVGILVVGIPIALVVKDSPERYGLLPDGEEQKPELAGAKARAGEDEGFTVKEALATPAFWLLATVFALRLMVTGAITTHVLPYLIDIGFKRETAATALGSIAAVSTVGRMGFGLLGDRLSKRLMIVALLASLAASQLYLCQVSNIAELIIFVALYAPSYGGLAVLMQSTRADYFGRRAFGTVMGYMNLFTSAGTAVGPIFTAWVWQRTGSYRLAFVIFAVTTLVALVIMLWAKPPTKRITESR